MSARRLPHRSGDRHQARGRTSIGVRYLEIADLLAEEDGPSINVCIGLAVLAGIAAGDAICLVATGQRSTGSDHQSAADLLSGVDRALGRRLRELIEIKSRSHYGHHVLTPSDRTRALRAAATLVHAARERVD